MQTDRHADFDLRHDILEALDADDEFAGDVGVRIQAGVVTLTGSVPSLNDRVIAERVVRHLQGVDALRIAIEIESPVD